MVILAIVANSDGEGATVASQRDPVRLHLKHDDILAILCHELGEETMPLSSPLCACVICRLWDEQRPPTKDVLRYATHNALPTHKKAAASHGSLQGSPLGYLPMCHTMFLAVLCWPMRHVDLKLRHFTHSYHLGPALSTGTVRISTEAARSLEVWSHADEFGHCLCPQLSDLSAVPRVGDVYGCL